MSPTSAQGRLEAVTRLLIAREIQVGGLGAGRWPERQQAGQQSKRDAVTAQERCGKTLAAKSWVPSGRGASAKLTVSRRAPRLRMV